MEVRGSEKSLTLPMVLLCLWALHPAPARGEDKNEMVEALYGAEGVSLPCLPGGAAEEFDHRNLTVYWKRDSNNLLSLFDGKTSITDSSSPSAYRLGGDASLVLRKVDWNSTGTYTCTYLRRRVDRSFQTTTVNLRVKAVRAEIEECLSATNNHSNTCRISFGAPRQNITCSKTGLNYAADFRLEFEMGIELTADFGIQKRDESDSSTSIIHRFEVGVEEIEIASKVSCVLVDVEGSVLEEISAELVRVSDGKAGAGEQTGGVPVAGISAGAIIGAGIVFLALIVIVFFFKRRAHAQYQAPYDTEMDV